MKLSELQAMSAHIKTSSAPGMLGRLAYRATSGAGRGALLGGGVGAVSGAAKGIADGEDGRDVLRRAAGGAVLGGAVGAAAGGAGRVYRDAKLLRPELSGGKALAQHVGSGAKRFAQRQVHSLTGTMGDKNIGLRGSARAVEKNKLLKKRLAEDIKHQVADPQKLRRNYSSNLASNLADAQLGDDAKRQGLTSIPGVVKGLVTAPKETVKGTWRQAKGGGGSGMAAFNIGLPAAFGAHDIAKGDESESGGLSRKQKALRTLGQIGGGFATAGMPIAGMMVGGELVDAGMRRAGRYTKQQEQGPSRVPQALGK